MKNNLSLENKVGVKTVAHSWDLCPETGEWIRLGSKETVFLRKGERLPAEHAPAIWKLKRF